MSTPPAVRQAYLPLTREADWCPEAPPSLDGVAVVDLDCETTGVDRFDDRPVGLAVGWADQTRYLPFAHRAGGNLDEAVVRRWAQTELRGKTIRNLNTKFDIHMLANWGVDLRAQANTFEDVAFAEALLDDHERAFTLEALAQKRLGRGKQDAGPPASLADQHASAVAAYACHDVALVRDLAAVYAPLLEAEELGRVWALESELIPATVEMERNGIPLDEDRLARWLALTARMQEDLAWEAFREAGFAINPDSPAHLQRLFRQVGAHWGVTDTGAPSFTAEVMTRAAARCPVVQTVYRLGKVRDLRAKSLVLFASQARRGHLYPEFHQLKYDFGHGATGGTVSGRYASAKPNGQNIQAKDKYDREYKWLTALAGEPLYPRLLCRPAGGCDWLAADKHQVELRIAAAYAKAARVLEAYAVDPLTDFHDVTHALLRRVRPATTRTECKTTSFTRLYGGGAGTIAHRLRLERVEVDALLRDYDAAFPEWGALLARAQVTAETRGYVVTRLGRRARFRAGDRMYAAANRVIQGTAADDMKLTVRDVYRDRRALGVTLRATIHDELALDVPTGDTTTVARVRACLDTPRLDLPVPLPWGVGVGPTWHDAKG